MRLHIPASALLLFCLGAATLSFASDLALVHARIYRSPTAAPIQDGTVLIHDNRITAVGPSHQVKPPRFARAVTVIDCTGRTVTAGFWNSHVHILTPELLNAKSHSDAALSATLDQMLTRWGFTTVFDVASVLGNTNELRARIAAGRVRGPRILTVGEPFYPKGGTPIYVKSFLEKNHIPSAEVQSIDQAVTRARYELSHGADGLKIFTGAITAHGVLPFPVDIAKALVEEAHRADKPVFAHPSNIEGILIALESGVDVLAHTTAMGGDWQPALIARMKAAHMALVPTLTLFDVEAKKAKVSPAEEEMWISQVVRQLKLYSSAGGEILFGTDIGYIDQADTTEEFALMSRAGMSFPQILASLTANPAQRFGYKEHSGRVAQGMDADLVVLDGDPATDITAFSKVRDVVRAGKLIYRADAQPRH